MDIVFFSAVCELSCWDRNKCVSETWTKPKDAQNMGQQYKREGGRMMEKKGNWKSAEKNKKFTTQ